MSWNIRTQDLAPPFVRRVGARLERAAQQEENKTHFAALKDLLVVKSATDPQRATVSVRGRTILVDHGGASDNAPTLIVHPLTLEAAESGSIAQADNGLRCLRSLLQLPHRPWQQQATEFWRGTSGRAGTPARVRFVCTDDASEIEFGDGEIVDFTLHGSAEALSAYFRGDLVLLYALAQGDLDLEGTMNGLSVMQGNGLSMLLGDDV